MLISSLITGFSPGSHSVAAHGSAPTEPVKREAEQMISVPPRHSLIKLTFPAIIHSDLDKEYSHVQDAAHIQVAKVYPVPPQRRTTVTAKNTDVPPSLSTSLSESRKTNVSAVTEAITNIKFVILGAVLLMLGGLFISSLLPPFSGAQSAAGAQARMASRLKATDPKIYETEPGKSIDLSVPIHPASSPDRGIFTFEEAPLVKKDSPLGDVSDTSAGLEASKSSQRSVSLSSAGSPSPALLRTTKSFFTLNHFECMNGPDDRVILRAKRSPYSDYGEIPLFLVPGVSLCDALVQELYTSVRQSPQKTLVFVVVETLPQASAYQQILEYALEKNFQIVVMSSQQIVQAVRTSQCPQVFEKIMASIAARNEYESMTPVENPHEFFGREELLDSLRHSVSHLQHIGLFGLRSIGKTSLLWQLREQLSQHIIAYIDLQHVPRNCSYLYREIVRECFRDASFKYPELVLPVVQDLDAGQQEHQSIQFIQTLTALWEALKLYRHDVKILLLLDEAECFTPTIEGQDHGFTGFHEFLGIIRGISQQYGFLVSMIVSSDPEISRLDTWKGQSNPGFQFYKEVFLPLLTENGCNHMIESLGAQMGLQYTEEALSRIYYETGGHPYITRQLCGVIAEMAGVHEYRAQGYSIQSREVENAISDYLEYKSDYLSSVWQRLSSVEQEILLTIATNHSCALKDLVSPAEDYDARRRRRKAISTLTENELVEKCENKYSIKMGLFERFVLASN
ncbi:hypothetical protein CSB45_04755 [candidate division KSB3 bacterium]|uniref:Orc1-like AAA ATPase domain-containing protein n=1 Tax=candidate division KSB3 bacterium TaxID=2044937 RepID=A0A2G6E806_9BACT|nr:MAG: hypothetical protein CSB45_04755 [candidate division KSB3 bacterium]PIE30366.1 MAG: hypothetical protein CSA57_03525 [candidate division KSB3 bacterium]